MRPLPVRVLVTTNTPFCDRVVDAFVLRAAGRARAGDAMTMPLAPRRRRP